MSQKPVIPDGIYHLKFGVGEEPGGLYATASTLPGEDVRAEALEQIPPTKTQHVGSDCILWI
jgi:hypothetical protein